MVLDKYDEMILGDEYASDEDEIEPVSSRVYCTRTSGIVTPRVKNRQECLDYIRSINIRKPQRGIADISWNWLNRVRREGIPEARDIR